MATQTVRLSRSQAELAIVLHITSKRKNIASHVPLVPPEAGLTRPSFIKCEDIRSISVERLSTRLGRVSWATLTGSKTAFASF